MSDSKTFPAPGTKLTYKEALEAYDDLESYMLSRVYCPDFIGNVEAYDLSCELNSIAEKYGLSFNEELKELLHRFSMERTALANGVNGRRFYLLGDTAALAKHDETHLFEVGIDGEKLRKVFDKFVGILERESSEVDMYENTFSPSWPDWSSRSKQRAKNNRVVTCCFVAMTVVFVICLIVHTFFGVGACSRWFM